MGLNVFEIVSLFAGVFGVAIGVWQLFTRRNDIKDKKKNWVKQACDGISDISRIMGIGKMDRVLRTIHVQLTQKDGPDGTLHDLINTNNESFNEAKAKMEVILNNAPVSTNITKSFGHQINDILDQYLVCRDDLSAIVALCDAREYADVNRILDERGMSISDDLRGAIVSAGSAHGDVIPFDLASFISDVIGIRFVDSQIPDYSEQMNQLKSRLQETVSSNLVSLSKDKNSRDYIRHGSPEAQLEKAEEYYYNKDYDEAFTWFMKAAAQNKDVAYFRLGECYEKGEGCTKNLKKAADNYQRAADLGLAIAEYQMGMCYEFGRGRETDTTLAYSYYNRSAGKEYNEALYKMGLCYWFGRSGEVDKQKSRQFMERAAQKGCILAQRDLSTLFYLDGDLEKSAQWAKAAADNNDVDGMGYYGYLLMISGAEKNDYLPWLTKSAEGGNPLSQFDLGVIYLGEKNLGLYSAGYADEFPETEQSSEAQKWFKMAAESGDPASQYLLGMFYLRKNKELKAAEISFEQALGNGFMWAHFGLGIIQFHMVHNSEAREHLENAWNEGNPFAGDYLRQMYLLGFGVAKDRARAYYYQSSAVYLACKWLLSKSDKQLADLKQWCVPPVSTR